MGNKVFISVDKCQSGMKMGQTVFNDYGAVIVSEGSILDDHMIRKLQVFRIPRVLIYKISDEKIIENNSRFVENYDVHVDIVKDVIKDISNGKTLDKQEIDNVIQTVVEEKKENRDIVYCINQVRDKHEYTYVHSMNVSLLCMLIGKWLNFNEEKIKELSYAGLLHDIGKAKINVSILNKPGALTPEEFEEIKKHVLYGYRLIETIPGISKEISLGVLMHHEREDGSGYILGAKGEQISEYAKIIAVADVYDAMTSNRAYRERQCPFEVFEHIQEGTFGKFDPKITLTFLNNLAAYYVGDRCKLNNGQVAEIIRINSNFISRPLIKIEDDYIDLTKNKELKLIELVP